MGACVRVCVCVCARARVCACVCVAYVSSYSMRRACLSRARSLSHAPPRPLPPQFLAFALSRLPPFSSPKDKAMIPFRKNGPIISSSPDRPSPTFAPPPPSPPHIPSSHLQSSRPPPTPLRPQAARSVACVCASVGSWIRRRRLHAWLPLKLLRTRRGGKLAN